MIKDILRYINEGNTLIISDIGSNHNQKLDTAKRLIDAAVDAGVDAVKFQSALIEELYVHPSEELRRLFEKVRFDETWYHELNDYCKDKDIIFFSSATYFRAVDILEKLDVKLYKIASAQAATFPQLVEYIAQKEKPVILSSGCCDLFDIQRNVGIINKYHNKLLILHCVSEYPIDSSLANLRFIKTLQERFGNIIGFSDHSFGTELSVAAVALGAKVIEKHLTLSRNQNGPDHSFAMEPHEFKTLVSQIRNVEAGLGDSHKFITNNEIKFLNSIRMKTLDGVNFRRDIYGIDAVEYYG